MRKTTKKFVAAVTVAVLAVFGLAPAAEAAKSQPANHWCC